MRERKLEPNTISNFNLYLSQLSMLCDTDNTSKGLACGFEFNFNASDWFISLPIDFDLNRKGIFAPLSGAEMIFNRARCDWSNGPQLTR